VHVALDVPALQADLVQRRLASTVVHSRAANRGLPAPARSRPPPGARQRRCPLQALAAGPGDLAVVLADGLSAVALQRHAVPVLQALRTALDGRLTLAPPVIATQARVALGDEIGALLQARLVLVLLGERPGLSSPDSLGAYLTHGRHASGRLPRCPAQLRQQHPAQQPARCAAGWPMAAGVALNSCRVLRRVCLNVSNRSWGRPSPDGLQAWRSGCATHQASSDGGFGPGLCLPAAT
jgi:ethanolamine ammonia-lyase small subunit